MLRILKGVVFASLAGLLSLVSIDAKATLITFDDLTFVPGNFYDQPLTNEYAALGLVISGGYLAQGGPAVVSSPNYLLGSNLVTFDFLGSTPTTVSMYVSTSQKDIVTLAAFGISGLIETKATQGWGGPLNDTPYTPQQFISFYSPGGISQVTIAAFFGLRTDAQIDNLYFSSATAVDAPSSLALLGIGFLGWAGLTQLRRGEQGLTRRIASTTA